MTDPRLTHRAKLVAELQERLSNALSDDDADFLATALVESASDLEAVCISALREAKIAAAMAEGTKTVEAEIRARRQRLERKDETIRAAVANAMQEAGIQKIVSDDMTISMRMGKAPLIIDREPDERDYATSLATRKLIYAWNKDAVRRELDEGDTLPFARLGNPCPQIVVRSK